MQFEVCPDLERYPDFIMPKRASGEAAGVDLFAQEDMIISEETVLFDLGFRAAVPKDHVGIIFPRSGLGAKFNCQLANTLGVIDSDYRGEWRAALHLGEKGTKRGTLRTFLSLMEKLRIPVLGSSSRDNKLALHIPKGDAYAQVLFFPVPKVPVVQVDSLDETERGEGGFGSTTAPRA